MREITEIVLLDYIFSQQDRIGNIDFCWHWYWVQDGDVNKKSHKGKFNRSQISRQKPLTEIAPFKPTLIQRIAINDNDAGGRVPIHQYIEANFVLDARQRRQITKNTHLALGILKDTKQIGKLQFDLDKPSSHLLKSPT